MKIRCLFLVFCLLSSLSVPGQTTRPNIDQAQNVLEDGLDAKDPDEHTRTTRTPVNDRIVAWTKRHRPELLSVAFVAQILASPIADRDPHAGAVLALTLFTTLAVGASYQVNRKVAYLALGPFCLICSVINPRTSRSNNGTSREDRPAHSARVSSLCTRFS